MIEVLRLLNGYQVNRLEPFVKDVIMAEILFVFDVVAAFLCL